MRLFKIVFVLTLLIGAFAFAATDSADVDIGSYELVLSAQTPLMADLWSAPYEASSFYAHGPVDSLPVLTVDLSIVVTDSGGQAMASIVDVEPLRDSTEILDAYAYLIDSFKPASLTLCVVTLNFTVTNLVA